MEISLEDLLIFSFIAAHTTVANRTPILFIFGDSILDAGNNNYINTSTLDQANFWPYGMTHFRYPTGRFCDGRLISDFIADFSHTPIPLPYLQPGFDQYQQGVNFASAGAGALVETFQGFVIDLKAQLSYFRRMKNSLVNAIGKDKTESIISGAVFFISIGTNDYLSPFLTNSATRKSQNVSDFVGMVIGNMTQGIQEIYEAGGRKFAIMNILPFGCVPNMRLYNMKRNGTGCVKEATLLVSEHNKALFKLLLEVEEELKSFRYSLIDINTYIWERLKNPFRYGFNEVRSACCGSGRFRGEFSCGGKRMMKEFQLCKNPNQFLFWDSIHPTEEAYRQVAGQIWKEHPRSTPKGSRSLQELFH